MELGYRYDDEEWGTNEFLRFPDGISQSETAYVLWHTYNTIFQYSINKVLDVLTSFYGRRIFPMHKLLDCFIWRGRLLHPFYDTSWGGIFTAWCELALYENFHVAFHTAGGKDRTRVSRLWVRLKASEFGQNDKLRRLENNDIHADL